MKNGESMCFGWRRISNTRGSSEIWQGRTRKWVDRENVRDENSSVMVVGYVWVLDFGLGDPREYIVGSDGHVSVDSI